MKKILLLLLFLMIFPMSSEQAPPSRPNNLVNGTVADAGDVNENENALYNYLQTGVDTYKDDTIVNADVKSNADIAVTKISGTAVNLTLTQTISGGKTFTGAVTLPATGVVIGTPNQGDVYYDDGTDLARLTPGTAGYFLKTSGTSANPLWAISGTYYQSDSTCIVAYQHAGDGTNWEDLSWVQNAVTSATLTEADLVAGKVSPLCYDYDGATDYAVIATSALQASMNALTIEAWLYRDTTGTSDYYIANVTDGYIRMQMQDSTFDGRIVTASGTEAISATHGLSGSGANQWVHIIVTWDKDTAADVYVNGVNKNGGDGNGDGAVSDSANGINIGADESNGSFFAGKIDGVRLLRRKMGATEMVDRYNSFK